MNTKPLLRYRLLLGVLSPWLFFKTAIEGFKARSPRYFLQRSGFSYTGKPGHQKSDHQKPGHQKSGDQQSGSPTTDSPVWIHCASVGEVVAARPLVDRIQQQMPDVPLLLTTTTATGADTVVAQGWKNLQHQYLPVDFRRSVKKFFNVNRPRALLIMETEIWPNLILYARQQAIPVLIINGRLSNRTLSAPEWLKPVYRQVLPEIDAILCKSESDVQRYTELGADIKSVQMVGNIKFATPVHQSMPCDVKRPFWLAASTHEDEELQLCKALKGSRLLEQSLLVIAPRHPHRSTVIQKSVADCGLRFAVRSKSELPDDDTQVYIADTLGEMNSWLSAAQLVFMGGSMVPVGGHNLLQPASAGVAIIGGQHLANVAEEAGLLIEADAMIQVHSATELITCVETLLNDVSKLQLMGQKGREIVSQRSSVLSDYMDHIKPFISTRP